MCWHEFLATGEQAALEHLITGLDQPDAVRTRLTAWVSATNEDDDRIAHLTEVGFGFDDGLTPDGDLDLFCFQLARGGVRIFELLPFRLDPGEMHSLMAKAGTLHLLHSNAVHHPLIRPVCQAQAAEPGGDGRGFLLGV